MHKAVLKKITQADKRSITEHTYRESIRTLTGRIWENQNKTKQKSHLQFFVGKEAFRSLSFKSAHQIYLVFL